MKILFFIESLRSGGKERRMIELIKGLIKYPDIEIQLVLTKKQIDYNDIYLTGVKLHFIPRKYLKKDPTIFLKFYRIARNFQPDIIHVWGNLVAVYAIPAKILLRIPLINNQITNAMPKVNFSILGHKLTFPFSDIIISNTLEGLKSFNAPENKSRVIYNGFDFKRIEVLENIESVKLNMKIQTIFIVGMVATFSGKKDYTTFISAANVILKNRKDITFLCIGSGEQSVFKTMVDKPNTDRILFFNNQQDIESIMNVCNIGVLMTDKNHGEGISNSLLEFMALSKPVIANNGGGTKELIRDGQNGFLIENGSVTELADKIDYLISNQEISADFGRCSRKIVEEKFNIESMIINFLDSYKSFLTK